MQHRKQIAESEGLEPGVVMSPIEEQYVLNEYGVLLGTLTVQLFYLQFQFESLLSFLLNNFKILINSKPDFYRRRSSTIIQTCLHILFL